MCVNVCVCVRAHACVRPHMGCDVCAKASGRANSVAGWASAALGETAGRQGCEDEL